MAKSVKSSSDRLTAEIRVQVPARLADLLAHECDFNRKKPAQIITDALAARYDYLPRLEMAIEAVENVYGEKQAIAMIADQIADGLVAMAEADQLRETVELYRQNETLREELGRAVREIERLKASTPARV